MDDRAILDNILEKQKNGTIVMIGAKTVSSRHRPEQVCAACDGSIAATETPVSLGNAAGQRSWFHAPRCIELVDRTTLNPPIKRRRI